MTKDRIKSLVDEWNQKNKNHGFHASYTASPSGYTHRLNVSVSATDAMSDSAFSEATDAFVSGILDCLARDLREHIAAKP